LRTHSERSYSAGPPARSRGVEEAMKRSILFAAGLCLAAGLVAWTAPATAAGDVARGEELYHQLCSQCHGEEGEGTRVLDSDADVEAAAAYLASMPIQHPTPELEGGDATRGQTLYTVCIACHGLDGAGNEALGSPPINHQSDWYMLTQLQHFKAGVRGTAPGDVQGALMRPMSMTLADEQAMKDVIAFIMTLSKTQAAK
jgi:cytochrome c553